MISSAGTAVCDMDCPGSGGVVVGGVAVARTDGPVLELEVLQELLSMYRRLSI
jgi:hypothetical protein